MSYEKEEKETKSEIYIIKNKINSIFRNNNYFYKSDKAYKAGEGVWLLDLGLQLACNLFTNFFIFSKHAGTTLD